MKNRHIFMYVGLAALALLSCGKSDSTVISRVEYEFTPSALPPLCSRFLGWLIKTQALSFNNNDDVVVWDQPHITSGKVVGQLSLDTKVAVSEETSESYTISGQTAKWYHITNPVDGWVFGAKLSQ
jgi:hypothetical protein